MFIATPDKGNKGYLYKNDTTIYLDDSCQSVNSPLSFVDPIVSLFLLFFHTFLTVGEAGSFRSKLRVRKNPQKR